MEQVDSNEAAPEFARLPSSGCLHAKQAAGPSGSPMRLTARLHVSLELESVPIKVMVQLGTLLCHIRDRSHAVSFLEANSRHSSLNQILLIPYIHFPESQAENEPATERSPSQDVSMPVPIV